MSNYANLGDSYHRLGDLDQAAAMYQQALGLSKTRDESVLQANLYGELGHIYRRRGDLEQARVAYRKSEVLFRKLGASRKAEQIQSWLAGLDGVSLAP